MSNPNPSISSFLDFPWQNKVNELKEKGWLKPRSKMEIDRNYSVRSLGNFATRYYWAIYLFLITIYIIQIFTSLPQLILFIIMIIYSTGFILLFIFTFRKMTSTLLGALNLNGSGVFVEFLDKFGRGIDVKIACVFRKKWWIEYDILVMAYQWHKRDPVGFQQGFRKTKNKKELRLILGVS